MQTAGHRRTPLLFIFALPALVLSCAVSPGLRTEKADPPEMSGGYTVILYGCSYSEDLETVAVLDKEGDGLEFEPYAPAFRFRREKGVDAARALEMSGHFIRCHSSYLGSELRRILTPGGFVAGYELRPLLLPLTYGVSDVLDTDYRLKGDKVVLRVRLLPWIERMLRDGEFRREASF